MINKQNVLITGGRGFIGSHLTERLIELGHQVIIDNYPIKISIKKKILSNSCLKVIKTDINDFENLKKGLNKEEIDVIFHLAAYIPPNDAPYNFSRCLHTNVEGTLNILKIAASLGIKRFIYTSTVSVYAESFKIVVDENYPTIPKTVYGLTKLIGELYCRAYALEKKMNITILRLGGVFGPGRKRGAEYNFISSIINKKSPIIYGNDKNSNDSVYIEDVLNACKNLISITLPSKLNIFNIASGESTSLKELIKIINKHLNSNIKPVIKTKSNNYIYYIYDINTAKKLINYKPKSKKENIIKFIEEIKNL